jgi:ATP phosphoribosyltransferase
MEQGRIRIAIQRAGRLADHSERLLLRCGVDFERRRDQLINRCRDFPLDVMFVRDDDIPEYVRDGVCDAGIVGENVLAEKLDPRNGEIEVLHPLGFGACTLAIAMPERTTWRGLSQLAGGRVATSYPQALQRYLDEQGIANVEIVELAGSVEIAPALKIADGICDLVSTGSTLRANGLQVVETVLASQAVLIARAGCEPPAALRRLLRRIDGVLRACSSKYIMLNAPRAALDEIRALLPGMEAPTVIPLLGDTDRVAVHAVAPEDVFWETMDRLKEAGAESILVTPIEKIIL